MNFKIPRSPKMHHAQSLTKQVTTTMIKELTPVSCIQYAPRNRVLLYIQVLYLQGKTNFIQDKDVRTHAFMKEDLSPST